DLVGPVALVDREVPVAQGVPVDLVARRGVLVARAVRVVLPPARRRAPPVVLRRPRRSGSVPRAVARWASTSGRCR
ncbi:hypothetical protein, partial [Amycolatopsis magusensis]|uniref:hypothetical protein n=1 Tax=Amycolatopsis magusensis TaxID=882444 RepID=UPI0024A7C0CD